MHPGEVAVAHLQVNFLNRFGFVERVCIRCAFWWWLLRPITRHRFGAGFLTTANGRLRFRLTATEREVPPFGQLPKMRRRCAGDRLVFLEGDSNHLAWGMAIDVCRCALQPSRRPNSVHNQHQQHSQ